MDTFIYKKEQFIYEIRGSITKELCEDLMDNLGATTDETEITENDFSKKIFDCLSNELKTHLKIYAENINDIFVKTRKDNNDNAFYALKINHKHIPQMKFHKTVCGYTPSSPPENVCFEKRVNENENILKYIWFLNDYSGELYFWKTHKVVPTAGTLLIFPTAWLFPYEERTTTTAKTKYTIEGYIQNTIP